MFVFQKASTDYLSRFQEEWSHPSQRTRVIVIVIMACLSQALILRFLETLFIFIPDTAWTRFLGLVIGIVLICHIILLLDPHIRQIEKMYKKYREEQQKEKETTITVVSEYVENATIRVQTPPPTATLPSPLPPPPPLPTPQNHRKKHLLRAAYLRTQPV
jgi:hypothetical protein